MPFYAEAFGIKEKNVVPTGVPRTDVLMKLMRHRSNKRWKMSCPIIKGKKVILFAPTFRGSGHGTAHYPFFKIDFERFANIAKKITRLYL
ncbi:CDP-glycerol glycerophosphotransferase family protein [Staphylococcus aureus]